MLDTAFIIQPQEKEEERNKYEPFILYWDQLIPFMDPDGLKSP